MAEYYPPSERLKSQMYPYNSTEEFKNDVVRLHTSICRLQILHESKVSEIDFEIWNHFSLTMGSEMKAKLNELGYDRNDSFCPSPWEQLYPSIQENRREEFLYVMRGLIFDKLRS